jgi:hypothetical protein
MEQFVRDAVGTEVRVRAVEEVDHDANGKFRAVRSTARPDGPASRGGPGTGASFSR